ncbi:MAG: hypothetical protein CR997_07500 [Acidobacteria bacterium]|nr:MAG: hypothetical protein CR997_07500 [Acidobacteriota bacterium]
MFFRYAGFCYVMGVINGKNRIICKKRTRRVPCGLFVMVTSTTKKNAFRTPENQVLIKNKMLTKLHKDKKGMGIFLITL